MCDTPPGPGIARGVRPKHSTVPRWTAVLPAGTSFAVQCEVPDTGMVAVWQSADGSASAGAVPIATTATARAAAPASNVRILWVIEYSFGSVCCL
jgi:hypothetical protein